MTTQIKENLKFNNVDWDFDTSDETLGFIRVLVCNWAGLDKSTLKPSTQDYIDSTPFYDDTDRDIGFNEDKLSVKVNTVSGNYVLSVMQFGKIVFEEAKPISKIYKEEIIPECTSGYASEDTNKDFD